jgi:hypothetical protein
MAKNIILDFKGESSSFSFKPVDRSKLYGKKQRIVLDQNDNPCSRASLLEDGSLLLKSGMTGQGYFLSDGRSLKLSDLKGYSSDGRELTKVPSTLDVAQEVEGPIDPSEILDTKTQSLYTLKPENLSMAFKDDLKKGNIYKFKFNYREDYSAEVGFIFENDEGYFALIGEPILHNWLSLDVAPVFDFTDDIEDELDFEMM